MTFGQLVANAGNSSLSQWASIVTLLAEGLVIAGVVIGAIGAYFRWQRKKDRLEEEQDRLMIKNEVSAQLEGFKSYFEERFANLTSGVQRTVTAVERNSGSSIPDALSRLEKRQGTIDTAIQTILDRIEKLDGKSQ